MFKESSAGPAFVKMHLREDVRRHGLTQRLQLGVREVARCLGRRSTTCLVTPTAAGTACARGSSCRHQATARNGGSARVPARTASTAEAATSPTTAAGTGAEPPGCLAVGAVDAHHLNLRADQASRQLVSRLRVRAPVGKTVGVRLERPGRQRRRRQHGRLWVRQEALPGEAWRGEEEGPTVGTCQKVSEVSLVKHTLAGDQGDSWGAASLAGPRICSRKARALGNANGTQRRRCRSRRAEGGRQQRRPLGCYHDHREGAGLAVVVAHIVSATAKCCIGDQS
mmetsp:Transcript_73/g.212  ORF Transcript_73/g.212 Transcript_73/m.212 type:complete len:282 (-) Transcript_73:1436-2281(-)